MMLNYFPVKGGFSAILIPKTIMCSYTFHYKQHLGTNIVNYCQLYEHEEPGSSQEPHTKGAICLGPSVNEQVVFLFMSLNSAKNITRRSWGTILMPDSVVVWVNKLDCNEPNQFIFTDRRGCAIGDVYITGVDKNTGDSNKNQALQYSPHKFQSTEEI